MLAIYCRSINNLFILFYQSFSTLLDIDKLTPTHAEYKVKNGFSTLLDIDKLTLNLMANVATLVLVLCWILINLHRRTLRKSQARVKGSTFAEMLAKMKQEVMAQ